MNTRQLETDLMLRRLTAGYMDACKDKPADHNEIGLHYFMAGWDAGCASATPQDAVPGELVVPVRGGK